ncbi:putative RNA-directed DNA polymerase, eukaryota, reverse transcriptase zinc-binding domain protein [Tanacetum coccineum]
MAFFKLYKDKIKDHESEMNLGTVTPQVMLDVNDSNELEASVTVDEIKASVWDCGIQKARGPDGFSFLFLKSYLELLKSDVEASVRNFFYSSMMPKGMNSAFITLILKVPNSIHIKDYRPISLISMQYKIIAKILANREIMAWYKKHNQKLRMFKVNFEKAYDTVSWKFLDHMLSVLGFGTNWRSWIQSCLHSSKSSILVNGSPTSEFLIKRGLRQGDPLSPFLFIIVMEGLHIALQNAVDIGRASGMSTCPLSHCSGVPGRAPGVAPTKITTQRNTTWGATS